MFDSNTNRTFFPGQTTRGCGGRRFRLAAPSRQFLPTLPLVPPHPLEFCALGEAGGGRIGKFRFFGRERGVEGSLFLTSSNSVKKGKTPTPPPSGQANGRGWGGWGGIWTFYPISTRPNFPGAEASKGYGKAKNSNLDYSSRNRGNWIFFYGWNGFSPVLCHDR